MQVAELKERLKDLPDDAFVYLDDHLMPTPMGLVEVEFDLCNGYAVIRDENGRISRPESLASPVKIGVVTLTTYKIPEAGWKAAESSVLSGGNGQAGTRSKSKKKKSKRK